MFCKFCGTELAENANFCSRCGKIVDMSLPEEPMITEELPAELPDDIQESEQDTVQKEKSSLARKILTFAILGCAFAFTSYLSFIGLAFSIVSAALVRKYLKRYQYTERNATVGRALSIVGIIVSVVFTIVSIYDLVWYILGLF